MSGHEGSAPRDPEVRWWPAIVLLLGAAGAIAAAWGAAGLDRQARVIFSVAAGLAASIGLVVWLLLASRLRRRVRFVFALLLVAGAVAAATTLEIRGVSGDLVPIVALRGDVRAGVEAEPAAPPSPVESATIEPPEGAADYPRFLGPGRDGVLAGPELERDWIARPPREVWRRPVGAGWSAFAVAGGYAVTQEQHEERERVAAYALSDGRLLWSDEIRARHDDPLGGPGPRATPTIVGDRVYAIGGTGRLRALDLTDGRRLWEADLLAEHGADAPPYGVAASPLVFDGRVVAVAGGRDGRSLVAYRADNGSLEWTAGNHRPAYSSPDLHTLAGRRQIVVLDEERLTSHDPDDGTVLWDVPWPDGTENVSQPVVLPGDRLFVSSGYGVGGKLFRVASGDGAPRVSLIWESRALKAKFTNVVHRDGYLYGLDDGRLVGLDAADGSRAWKGGRYGHGQIILVRDLLLVQAENGDIALVQASPDRYVEHARLPVLDGRTWNHPALAGRFLLVRNDREAVCLELPVARQGSPPIVLP